VIDWVNDYIFHGWFDLTNVLLYSDEADMGRHGCFDLLCMVWLIWSTMYGLSIKIWIIVCPHIEFPLILYYAQKLWLTGLLFRSLWSASAGSSSTGKLPFPTSCFGEDGSIVTVTVFQYNVLLKSSFAARVHKTDGGAETACHRFLKTLKNVLFTIQN
jgi:hypothetical protein